MLDRRIKLRHLEAFAAIARAGTLKSACAALNLSQPALSKTLKDLEDILGARLMHRDRGGTQLTPEGEVFLEFSAQSLAALRRGVEGVGAIRAGNAEVLKVGSLPSVAARLMPPAVALFRRLSPDTRLTLRDGAHEALTNDLRSGALDMVIGRMGDPDMMQGLSFTQLYQEHVVCVADPAHPLQAHAPDPSELGKWPVLYPPEGAAIRPLLDRWRLAQGLGPFPTQIACVSGAFGRSFVPGSDALWFISEGVVAQDIAQGRLAALALDLGLTSGPVGLMTRPDDAPSRSQHLFARALAQAAETLPIS
ncbi:pca operon transcription factor PcaQ [Tropicibacter oceani]|uniref:Pca operon transcription factor PcaQ n=1 Tax=Tropicibacter oceani TaxID=3058420 RepID=A0ABY8QKL2_9RHOB|nr:pca operon transcription factor PcaQ [Tropicibacter oceani]WGW05164.1 pca operon transcription factor PcaQ [Tropicibacter oceani]